MARVYKLNVSDRVTLASYASVNLVTSATSALSLGGYPYLPCKHVHENNKRCGNVSKSKPSTTDTPPPCKQGLKSIKAGFNMIAAITAKEFSDRYNNTETSLQRSMCDHSDDDNSTTDFGSISTFEAMVENRWS